ncbi:preprotein translocase subunit SecD [Haloquadratum walsbyi]|uniref:Protein-export membrane protein SecD n=1 Tax=Haloquadratum walsbyi (strain DSM 16854 / JCM 12705 / C23) TaxID=768065 RepID=G0LMQ3_HALWC|nr:preprotein translocase subunit SecD [Haloquadratum walsbyi]CCC41373.1 protein-export membrane protein SecD [Haloquadratum walsbyi C23]
MIDFRENWRIILLVVVVIVSLFALVSPTLSSGPNSNSAVVQQSSQTNLQYGLELAGGTRVRAPLVGVTAEEVEFEPANAREVEQRIATAIDGAGPADVIARPVTETTGTVEVTVEGVSTTELQSILESTGYTASTVRTGVTETTRQEVVRILENKINEAGLSGGTVQEVTTAGGGHFILIEVPNEDAASVRSLVSERGTVVVQAHYPQDNTYTQQTVLQQDNFQSIGSAQEGQSGGAYVPVTVRESAANEFQQATVDTTLARPGGTRCTYSRDQNSTEPCLLLVVNGEVTNSFGMAPRLADSLRGGSWAQDPVFQLQTANVSEAQEVAINLRAGALPAKLDLTGDDGGTTSFISPSQGENFRTDSLLAGLVAVFAVSGVVFLRYRDARVALPMIVTALSEVLILLGFAAGIGYPLDLSVIAGFITVIGTGVDDLVIIADEVLAEGGVSSRRVFQSRFRRAFWVIGAAAATTIIAMSPLAILSLGDLQGFAIFTILGVLVGVLITRPAYGDILRALTTGNL